MFYWIGSDFAKRSLRDGEEYTEQFLTLLYLETAGDGNVAIGQHAVNETEKEKIKDVVQKISIQLGLDSNSTNAGKEREKQKLGEEEVARLFIDAIDFTSGEMEKNVSETYNLKIELMKNLKKELNMEDFDRNYFDELREEPKYSSMPNAGLVLLSPWLPRLFLMLGFLTDDKKDFRDMESRIRAIFVIQLCLGTDSKEFSELELLLNRILVGCPFSVPLPRTLELSKEEKDMVESMMNGVKANWTKMNNTSMKIFQESFINRPGHVSQEEKRWVLTVDERAYDILLDTLPWSFRYIRYPWLKKRMYVEWRSKNYPDF